jgi:hypothetical protein
LQQWEQEQSTELQESSILQYISLLEDEIDAMEKMKEQVQMERNKEELIQLE